MPNINKFLQSRCKDFVLFFIKWQFNLFLHNCVKICIQFLWCKDNDLFINQKQTVWLLKLIF